MSGKKASEVNQLLRNGEKTRSGAVDMLNSNYKKAQASVEASKRAISEAQSGRSRLTLSLDAAKAEFPEAAIKLIADMRALAKELDSLSGLSESDSLEKEYTAINKAYAETDRKAKKVSSDLRNKIRSQGRNDPWYCDNEYNAAEAVAAEYAALKSRVTRLNSRLTAESNRCGMLAAKAGELLQQAERIIAEGNALEKKAADATKLRADAAEAKKSVNADCNSIDPVAALNFMADEYNALLFEVSAFASCSDDKAVKGFSALTSKIREFIVELDRKQSEFLKAQKAAQAYLDNVSERLSNSVFSDPMSDFTAEGPKKMELMDFLEKFCNGRYLAEIRHGLGEAHMLFATEKFSEAEEKLNSLTALIDTASEYAALVHERRKMTIENAIAIRDTMLKLNYNVSSKILTNADGSFGGFDISCSAGDETILFEHVLVDDDGKFGFGIDHTESVSGTCASSWYDIRRVLAENGVYVKDITKNGKSINAPNAAAAKADVNQTAPAGK